MTPYSWFRLLGDKPSIVPKDIDVGRWMGTKVWRMPVSFGLLYIPMTYTVRATAKTLETLDRLVDLRRPGEHLMVAWARPKPSHYRLWPLYLPDEPKGLNDSYAVEAPTWATRPLTVSVPWTAHRHILEGTV